MVLHITWPDKRGRERSPFNRGEEERSLRLTFHDATLENPPADEALALEVLRDLANLPIVDALGTERGAFPHIELGSATSDPDCLPVFIRGHGHNSLSGIWYPQQALATAARLEQQADPQHPAVQAVMSHYWTALAHHTWERDLFVTLSPWLLQHRDDRWVGHTNPCRPSEAVRLLGLYLRSRGEYCCRYLGMNYSLGREWTYFVVTRLRLPTMWRFNSACLYSKDFRGDNTHELSESIRRRCARALEARDIIGQQFYCGPDYCDHDRVQYHFDYLPLLLTGAIDALARVVYRVYGLSKPNERRVAFRNWERNQDKYFDALVNQGATNLVRLLRQQEVQDVLTVLHELRNTIHAAALPRPGRTLGITPTPPPTTVIDITAAGEVKAAALRSHSLGHWGLHEAYGDLCLEPYACAVAMVDEAFGLINAIAEATEVTRLLPQGFDFSKLLDTPPADVIFGAGIGDRLLILG